MTAARGLLFVNDGEGGLTILQPHVRN